MTPPLCSRCKKNVAVIFLTRLENGKSYNEGLCLKCAKALGLKQVDDIMKRMGITDEDLENMSNEMMSLYQDSDQDQQGDEGNDDEIESRTATFPFLNRLFGGDDSLQPIEERARRSSLEREKRTARTRKRRSSWIITA